jgi:hypothetical protein
MKKQQEKELEPRINTNGHELKNKDQFLLASIGVN